MKKYNFRWRLLAGLALIPWSLIVLIALYVVKSALGINLFVDEHLADVLWELITML